MTDTKQDIDQLEQLFFEDNIVCEFCGEEANWMMMHDKAKHFNCNEYADSNQRDLTAFIAAGLKTCYCRTCEIHGIPLTSISIVPI